MASAPWVKAPWLLLRFPGLLFAVASAVVILAVATAASPLFASSAGNAVLTKQISPLCPWPIGLTVASYGPLFGDTQTFEGPAITPAQRLSQEDQTLARDTAGISSVGSPVRTIIGPKVDAAKDGASRTRSILLLTRDGGLDHVQKLSGGGNGLWITDRTAQGLGVKPGDQIRLTGGQGALVSTRVTGVYRNLADARVTPFWCSLTY
ncbi:MAG TPA: hypothetical protein VF972_10310, partial [Actinomycetota bacterium]